MGKSGCGVFDEIAWRETAMTKQADTDAIELRDKLITKLSGAVKDADDTIADLRNKVAVMREALDDAVATLLAVRSVSLSPEWQDCGPHFYELTGETIQRCQALATHRDDA